MGGPNPFREAKVKSPKKESTKVMTFCRTKLHAIRTEVVMVRSWPACRCTKCSDVILYSSILLYGS